MISLPLAYLACAGIVFGVNLLPALGPPTWAVLVLLMLHWHLNPAVVVAVGAASAGTGRLLLAKGTRALRGHIGEKRLANLAEAQYALTRHRAGAVAGLALFALAPVPSAQLFEAAGLLTVPLVPLTVAFFAGRVVSYSIYVFSAKAVEQSMGDVLVQALTSPVGIGLQILMVALMVVVAQFDVVGILRRRLRRRSKL